MEKAIDIKRRAQRCLQSGDLDGAVVEYEKLTHVEEPEPIHFVLLADLLFKKGDRAEASRRYLQAVDAYTGAGLYKNAIAVCKKMARLSLSPGIVLQRLAELHMLDGLGTEAALYCQELAELQAREGRFPEAAETLRKAFDLSPENPRLLEKAGDWQADGGDARRAAATLLDAARHYERHGQAEDAARARARAAEIDPSGDAPAAVPAAGAEAAPAAGPWIEESAEPVTEGLPEPEFDPATAFAPRPPAAPAAADQAPPVLPAADAAAAAEPLADAPEVRHIEGLETRRVFAPPAADEPGAETEAAEPEPAPGLSDVTPAPPEGLRFADSDPGSPADGPAELAGIEQLLAQASEHYRNGERDAAAEALVQAARAYEEAARPDSAASIYRSLGRTAGATPEILGAWLRNCEERGDHLEAAEVACNIGDRALNEGDLAAARGWFERALEHAPGHELALRRVQRLTASAPAPAAPPPAAPANGTRAGTASGADGRVEVAVGRAQAVTLDLGSLIAEFQRGLESQLSGDAQSHYDLAMTYREMGLYDQAVECFRAAGHDPAFALRSAEMVGRCLLDQGRFEDAAEEFARALERLGDTGESGACLRFHLGLAHEVAGRTAEALAEFERVHAVQPDYPDVAQKIRFLRRTLESV